MSICVYSCPGMVYLNFFTWDAASQGQNSIGMQISSLGCCIPRAASLGCASTDSLNRMHCTSCTWQHTSTDFGMTLGCIVHHRIWIVHQASLGCNWDARCFIHHMSCIQGLWDAAGMHHAQHSLHLTSCIFGMPLGCQVLHTPYVTHPNSLGCRWDAIVRNVPHIIHYCSIQFWDAAGMRSASNIMCHIFRHLWDATGI